MGSTVFGSSNSPHYADRVNIVKKIKLQNQWRFAPVVFEPNGRLKDKVRINGQIEIHAEGAYYLEWRVNGDRKRERVAKEDAVDQARRKAVELEAGKHGIALAGALKPGVSERASEPEVKDDAKRLLMGRAIDDYLAFIKTHRKKHTYSAYRYTLGTLLRAAYKKSFVDEVERQDIIDFILLLRARPRKPYGLRQSGSRTSAL